jgi:hypothetical protein
MELVSNPLSKTTAVTSVFDGVDVPVGFLLHPSHVRDLPQLILILPVVHSSEQKLKEQLNNFINIYLAESVKGPVPSTKNLRSFCNCFPFCSNKAFIYHNHKSKSGKDEMRLSL